MNIETEQLTSIVLSKIVEEGEIGRLDPITVVLKNYRPGVGEITITCFGKSWNARWGAMSGMAVEEFFVSCDDQYLIKNLAQGISSDQQVENPDWDEVLKGEILRRRREDSIGREHARKLWGEVEELRLMGFYSEEECHQMLYKVTDDPEWWYYLPREVNPDYKYLERIVQATRKGLKQWMSERRDLAKSANG